MKDIDRRGIINTVGYSYNDLTIVPCVTSTIQSRKECNVYDKNDMLPIFAAPMLSVTNAKNYELWYKNKIYAIMPRTVKYVTRLEYLHLGDWVALSRKEFKKLFIDNNFVPNNTTEVNVCVDLANGHMQQLYDEILVAKKKAIANNFKLNVMTGNIANPETYLHLCQLAHENGFAVVDYIRLSIGSGAGCLTASNTGVHFPIATLIDECKQMKDRFDDWDVESICPAIIADGGIRNYSDINKALALGADYVMIGSLLSGLLESSADVVIESNNPVKYPVYYDRETGDVEYYINYDESKNINIWDDCSYNEQEKQELIRSMKSITKRFIGMSTKEAQVAINAALEEPIIADKSDLKTSEGCTKFIPVKYTIAQWVENMIDYLRSAMSYCDARTLDEFREYTELIPNSPGEMMAVNK